MPSTRSTIKLAPRGVLLRFAEKVRHPVLPELALELGHLAFQFLLPFQQPPHLVDGVLVGAPEQAR